MTWVKIDDKFTDHPKLVSVGPLGIALQIAALCYSNAHLTDGFIQYNVLPRLLSWDFSPPGDKNIYTVAITSGMGGRDVNTEMVAGWLVDAGVWEEVEGGYQIHDYTAYQPSKAAVLEERAKAAERMSAKRNVRPNFAGTSPEQSENFAGTSPEQSENFAGSSDAPYPYPINDDHDDAAENPPTDAVFSAYEKEIGPLTPMIGQAIDDAQKIYPAEWFLPAMQTAARNNARSWAYVEAILKRWKVDGFQSDKRPKGPTNGRGQSPPSAKPPRVKNTVSAEEILKELQRAEPNLAR